jgi:hypothetical protein
MLGHRRVLVELGRQLGVDGGPFRVLVRGLEDGADGALRQRPQSIQASGSMITNSSPRYSPGLMQSTGQTETQVA